MLYKEIKLLLERQIAPKNFLINGETYGLQYGQAENEKKIKKILLTIDLNLESIHFAIKNKINLIISYKGLISNPINKFDNTLIKKLNLLSKYPILIFILNSSLISAEGGISDTIMELLYFQLEKMLEVKNNKGNFIPIGRICLPKSYSENLVPITLLKLLRRIKSNLLLETLSFVGELYSEVKKVCIIGSEIENLEYLKEVSKNGCDSLILGTINNELAILSKELKINLIKIPLYSCLNITMKKLSNYLSLEFPYDEFLFFEIKEPIKTYN
jgi:putative NIF3 family GTP cyclohydrolase 1 type 2